MSSAEFSAARFRENLLCFGVLDPPHHVWGDVLQRGRAELLHREAGFETQNAEHALDAGLAERPKSPQIGPADADGFRAHCQRLDDVAAVTKTAVDQDRRAAADRTDDLRQALDG